MIKPRGFYAEQLFKLKNKAREGNELTPKAYEKYYDGYLNKDGGVSPNPVIGITEIILRNRPWKKALNLPTKACSQCGEIIKKPIKMGMQVWEKKKHCSITCRKLSHEKMPDLSNTPKE